MPTRNAFLRHLVLLRHDPELADRVRAEAFEGNVDAQYALGLIFAEGRGVDEDPVEAYAWLRLAALQGDRDAVTLRYVVAGRMTPEECDRGEQVAAGYELQIRRRQGD